MRFVFRESDYDKIEQRLNPLTKAHSDDNVLDETSEIKTILNVPLNYRNFVAQIEVHFILQKISEQTVVTCKPNFRNLLMFFLFTVGVGLFICLLLNQALGIFIGFLGLIVLVNTYFSTLIFTRRYVRRLLH